MARRKRGNREGSIYFDKSKRLWCATISFYDGAGRQKRITRRGATKTEVADKLADLHQQRRDGALVEPSAMRIEELMERWLDSVEGSVSPSTIDSYRRIVANHVKPAIGRVRVSEIKPLHVEHALARMREAGKSASTTKHCYVVLNRAFAKAIRWGLLSRNPCDAVDTPKISAVEFGTLTDEQAGNFIRAIAEDRLCALYVLAIATGMRQGELFGLEWGDINFEAGTLSIRRKIVEVNGKFHTGDPKTKKGRRLIHLPPIAVDALREHRKRMLAEGKAWVKIVFCDSSGGVLRRQNVLRRSFRPLLKASGLPAIRFHDLRHTCATLLLSANVHPKIVQEQLGHSRTSITLDIYSHVMPAMAQEAAGRMDRILSVKGA